MFAKNYLAVLFIIYLLKNVLADGSHTKSYTYPNPHQYHTIRHHRHFEQYKRRNETHENQSDRLSTTLGKLKTTGVTHQVHEAIHAFQPTRNNIYLRHSSNKNKDSSSWRHINPSAVNSSSTRSLNETKDRYSSRLNNNKNRFTHNPQISNHQYSSIHNGENDWNMITERSSNHGIGTSRSSTVTTRTINRQHINSYTTTKTPVIIHRHQHHQHQHAVQQQPHHHHKSNYPNLKRTIPPLNKTYDISSPSSSLTPGFIVGGMMRNGSHTLEKPVSKLYIEQEKKMYHHLKYNLEDNVYGVTNIKKMLTNNKNQSNNYDRNSSGTDLLINNIYTSTFNNGNDNYVNGNNRAMLDDGKYVPLPIDYGEEVDDNSEVDEYDDDDNDDDDDYDGDENYFLDDISHRHKNSRLEHIEHKPSIESEGNVDDSSNAQIKKILFNEATYKNYPQSHIIETVTPATSRTYNQNNIKQNLWRSNFNRKFDQDNFVIKTTTLKPDYHVTDQTSIDSRNLFFINENMKDSSLGSHPESVGSSHLIFNTTDEQDYDEDDYLDDESVTDEDTNSIPYQSSTQFGSLTDEKWANYGTYEAVEKSRRHLLPQGGSKATSRNRPNSIVPAFIDINVRNHITRIENEGKCKYPHPKIIQINGDPSKIYTPQWTVLHRCGDDVGCCNNESLTCVATNTSTVVLYFYVKVMDIDFLRTETMSFSNHTECGCIKREQVSSQHRNTRTIYNTNRRVITTPQPVTQTRCNCVKDFSEILERIDDSNNSNIVRNQYDLSAIGYQSRAISFRGCRCDCVAGNTNCEWLKKGQDGFSIEDRRCINERRCTAPSCEYGQYMKRDGRCPKIEDKISGTRRLYFDE